MHFWFTWTYWFVICCRIFYDSWSIKIQWYFQDQRNVFYRCSVTLIMIAIIEFLLHAQLFLIEFNYFYRDSFLYSHMIGCIIIMRATFLMSMHFYPCYHKDLELYIDQSKSQCAKTVILNLAKYNWDIYFDILLFRYCLKVLPVHDCSAELPVYTKHTNSASQQNLVHLFPMSHFPAWYTGKCFAKLQFLDIFLLIICHMSCYAKNMRKMNGI